MKLEELVNEHYHQLNTNDKTTMKQIMLFKQEYANLSSEEIAKECHISRATLLRLCRKIGLNSFSDLKYLLKQSNIKEVSTLNNFESVCDNYRLLVNELHKISYLDVCRAIDHAQTIYVYGTGNEQKSIAQELKRIFMTVGKCVIDLFDYGEIEIMRDIFRKDDLFIVISLSGETREGIDIIRNIQGYIRTLSITRLQNNTISSLCDLNLYASTKTLDVLQETSYELVGVFYALLDFLFIHYIEYIKETI